MDQPIDPAAWESPTYINITPVEQLLVLISGLYIKPAYMFTTLLLICFLFRKMERGLALLRWSLIAFLLGEAFCAASYVFTGGESNFLEILHDLGMVGLGVFLPWGLFVLFDEWVFHLTPPEHNCVFQRLCGRCWKYHGVSCKLKRLFIFGVLALALISLIPLSAPLRPFYFALPVFGTMVKFKFSFVAQLLELRIYPVVGTALMLLSLIHLMKELPGMKRAQLPFFTGLGFMGFALFRFILLYGYNGQPQWLNLWEELTELLVVAGFTVFLILFRKPLQVFRIPRVNRNSVPKRK